MDDQIRPVLVIHGGAGTLSRLEITAEQEKDFRTALKASLVSGYDALARGQSALDAVQISVKSLEDCPLFNAGRGAVFTHDGTNEMDASIMDGSTQRAGAVTGVRHVRNPIVCARSVMDLSEHVMLSGEGAEKFAAVHQLPMESPEYFFNEFRWKQLQEIKETEKTTLDHTLGKIGTVGAVALDVRGNLAAASSTGGMTNKRYGRVGDSPLIGCGTYANQQCAISCTGHGEFFIRTVAAHSVAMAVEYGGKSVHEAALSVIFDKVGALGGQGGLIAVDAKGNITMPFNTEGMYRGFIDRSGDCVISIFKN